MRKAEEMDKMLRAYLAAVAAQLPHDRREDIVAELEDEILARAEARSRAIGRPLAGAEFEILLREVGHPLVVAARYGDGPQGITGPDLYPWWLFAVKMALSAVVLLAVLGLVFRVVMDDADVVQAAARAVHQGITGGLMAVGAVTAVVWGLERQPRKPQFLTQWRVADLGMVQWSGLWNEQGLRHLFAHGTVGTGPQGPAQDRGTHNGFSPAAGAAASAVWMTVVLAWWLGLFSPGVDFIPAGDAGTPALLRQVHQQLYGPVAILLGARIMFDTARVLTRSPVRFTAAGDAVFAVTHLGLLSWFWVASPLSPLIRADSLPELLLRMSGTRWQQAPLEALLTAVFVAVVIAEVVGLVGAVLRLATGRDRRQPQVQAT